jgi:hypothetical protein
MTLRTYGSRSRASAPESGPERTHGDYCKWKQDSQIGVPPLHGLLQAVERSQLTED